jgi:hypothetical protein
MIFSLSNQKSHQPSSHGKMGKTVTPLPYIQKEPDSNNSWDIESKTKFSMHFFSIQNANLY